MKRRTPALALAALALVLTSAGAGQAAAIPSPSASKAPSPSATPTSSATPSAKGTPAPKATPTPSDGTLQILTYRGYAEYGGTSPKVNWVGTFEKETGCRIARLDQVQNREEMEKQLEQRSYDVISAGPDLAGKLIAGKQVSPINQAKVAGYADLSAPLRELTTVGGKVYGVPFLWGVHEYLYDADRIKKPSLEQVFTSPKSALQDDPLTIADAALAWKTSGSPYELTAAELERVMTTLEGQPGRTYWGSPVDVVKGFATGRLDYAQATPYLRLVLRAAGKPVKAIKTARTTGWVDSWMLGAGGNQECAYRWLAWTASAETQRAAASWNGLAPAGEKACKEEAKLVCAAYGAGKGAKPARIEFAVRPPGDCRPPEGECTDYATWRKRWLELVK
ncbi:extracellular solute-binding protein [Nonomuraea typhae]|uniref:Extracellular solute-binding protein n=1 Tax=Nonomuraea typhae TaxID=2603600 RepID=A0ABW7ZFG7_9ACTN